MGFTLEQKYPNPFNSATTIIYQLAQSDKVSINIYNLLGHSIKTLVNEEQLAGNHSIIWDGKDDNGKTVPSGISIDKI